MAGKQIKFGSLIEESLHSRVKAAAAKSRMDLKDVLSEAFEMWLGYLDAKALSEPTESHRKLTVILESGDEATISAVTQNIDVFYDRLRPARPQKRKAG